MNKAMLEMRNSLLVHTDHFKRNLGRTRLFLSMLLATALATGAAQTGSTQVDEVHTRLRKAEELLRTNQPEAAATELKAVLVADPKNAEAYADLGTIAFFHRDYERAAQYLRNAVALDPALIKSQALLGMSERRLGDPSARALLEHSFPKLKDQNLRLQTGLELAALYDQQGDPAATAAVVRTLVNLDPEDIDVLYMAQRVYSELADETLNKLAILAPGSARMQQVIAERLVNEGDLKKAIEHYRQALQIDPRLPGVHFELGEAILQSARADPDAEVEAQKEFELDVQIEGQTAKAECELASIALSHSQTDQAFAHYQRAYQLDPNEIDAQLGLAKLLMHDNPEEAVKYLQMAVRTDPLNGSAHYQLAQVYRRLQKTELSRKEMRLSLEIRKTKEQVGALYHEMNREWRNPADDMPPGQELNHEQ
jgi:tetratricopeptide (TPR) repeat protein